MKKIIKIFLVFVIVIVAIHVISAFTLDKNIEYKEVSFYSPNIPAEMDGYKIAFLTDTHSRDVEQLEEIVLAINELQPDLLLLGGDFDIFISHEQSMKILSKIETTDGIYGVEGNHDEYNELFTAMRQYDIQPLSNNGVHIREGFYLAGVEDMWNRNPDVAKAMKNANSNDFTLLLAHNPDITMTQDTTSIDLILSGHTHGGQITFLGILAPALLLPEILYITNYGQRFMSGWAESYDGTPVYTSNGANTFPPRIFAPPQVILIILRSEE